jgi:hypothetical protein
MEARNPAGPLEWFETKCPDILETFRKQFSPKLILASVARVAAILPIDGDSRDFLTHHVMNMDKRRVYQFNRPIHLLGLHLTFPAYEMTGKQTSEGEKSHTVASENWAAEVRVESYPPDASKLLLNVNAQWPIGTDWNIQETTEAVGRLEITKKFLSEKLLPFLTTELDT